MKPCFLDALQIERLDGKSWKVVKDLRYRSAVFPAIFVVPKGFVTDLASVPRLPLSYWLLGNTAHASAVVHDFLYQARLPKVKRKDADDVFLEAMDVEEVPWRWIIYSGVRAGGGRAWRTGPDRYKVLNS